jgi:HJR/Mrr/RecB family endonuclease
VEVISAMNGLAKVIGQESLIARLRAMVEFSRSHETSIDHIALVGPQGHGKRTIVRALAEQLEVGVRITSAKTLERKGDLTAILTSLDHREIIYLEDINQLRQALREILLLALKDFRVDLVIGEGPGARIHSYHLNQFSCVCGVPRQSEIPPDIRDVFGLVLAIQKYSVQELARIASLHARQAGLSISPEAAELVARASGDTPSQVALLIERLRKAGHSNITNGAVVELFDAYGFHQHSNRAVVDGRLDSLGGLSGIQFEELIFSVLQKMGFRSEMTSVTGDGGIDIIVVLEKPIVGGRYLIQCKRFAEGSLVGAPAVREFYGAFTADKKAIKGILITTSGFTKQARDFAENLPLELIDARGLRELLEN